MKQKKLMLFVGLIIVASMVLAACQPAATATVAPAEPTAVPPVEQPTAAPTEVVAPTEEPTPVVERTTRKGGWLDEIDFSVVDSASVITQLQAGAIDIYADSLPQMTSQPLKMLVFHIQQPVVFITTCSSTPPDQNL